MNFREKLIEAIETKRSIVCMGIDPDIDAKQFPEFLKVLEFPKFQFAKKLIDKVYDSIACIKVNTRFFMSDELDQLKLIVEYAHEKGLLVIGDCKQNDIGNTMAMAYRKEFEGFNFDAITVNGYFGSDGIITDGIFDKWYKLEKGLFVLIKTSNNSSKEIQDVNFVNEDGRTFWKNYHLMASLTEEWSQKYEHVIGGVVGATDLLNDKGEIISTSSTMVKEISKILRGILLLPGYGAQGGTSDSLKYLEKDSYCIVNSSRGIMYAHDRRFKGRYNEEDFALAASDEVGFMNEDLNKHFKYK